MNQKRQNIDEHLLLQYLLGNVDDVVRNRVETWLNADSRNRKQLDRLEALWLETGRLDPPPLPVDLNEAWEQVSSRIGIQKEYRPVAEMKSSFPPYIRYALSAAAVVLLVFGIYFIFQTLTTSKKAVEIVANSLIVRDTLTDGTRIALNRQSKLTYSDGFKSRERLIKLTGEAFFEVSKDPARPFVVETGVAKVRVLGTVFNIRAYPGRDMKVSVTEGRVLFFTMDPGTGDTLSVILEAGMSGILKTNSGRPEICHESLSDQLFWVNGNLDFNGTPLSEVFRVIEKHYGIKISNNNPDILNCKLTTSFANDPVNRIMMVIAESFGLELSIEGNNYHLNGEGCR